MHTIPLALATLSTVAAAINSGFDPFCIIIWTARLVLHPCSTSLNSGPALLGDKNNISIIDRQP